MGYTTYAPRKFTMSVVGRDKVEKVMKFILVDEINENVESINVRNTTALSNFVTVNGNNNDTSMDVSFKNAETLAKAQLELLK